MPQINLLDSVLLSFGTLTKQGVLDQGAAKGRYPLPTSELVEKVVSDRLVLAGGKLKAAQSYVLDAHFRSSISRSYYAMYHAARAVAFAFHRGDDFERHIVLPRNLPSDLDQRAQREIQLTEARLLRNQADYDPYPSADVAWEQDARNGLIVASEFLSVCEDYALAKGYV